jgi:hypothetical protein
MASAIPRIYGAALIVTVAVLMVPACSDVPGENIDTVETYEKASGSAGKNGKALDTKDFWAQDLTTNGFYSFKADLLAEGERCNVWVEQASMKYISDIATANKIAAEYDKNIYDKMIAAFSIDGVQVELSDGNVMEGNIMEAADWLTDGNGKLTILLLDIKDGYTANGSYVAGYFTPVNFYMYNSGSSTRSNEMDMIYLDTYPSKQESAESYTILAHEMQHLMNFVTTLVKRNDQTGIMMMDTWIDEGLSSAAEYVYMGSHVKERYDWFNDDRRGTIAKGNNFFVWGNLADDSILDDYATVYLFFQWLRIHQDSGKNIYKDIITSTSHDYNAVVNAAHKNISWYNDKSWSGLLEAWLAANYINAESGKYGYKNDSMLKNVKAKTAPAVDNLPLLPGEAVYSITSNNGDTSSYASGSGSNIRYAGLKKGDEGTVSPSSTYSGGALLTYNANSDCGGSKETGKLTGRAETASVWQSVLQLGMSGAAERGPVRIDARDMLARNGLPMETEALTRNIAPLQNAVLTGNSTGE